jgi:hypothetical protein
MAHFLMITDAPEGVKPHPLDTQLVMLPEGVNPYRLLAAACRFTAEGGVLDVPGGDDEVAYAILRTRFTQMAADFDRATEARHESARLLQARHQVGEHDKDTATLPPPDGWWSCPAGHRWAVAPGPVGNCPLCGQPPRLEGVPRDHS